MDSYCTFLELLPELRNIIYEYVAVDEGGLHIKRKQRAKHGQHVASRSGLTLANSQIYQEYAAVVQEVSLWSDVKLRVLVRDFNFRHFEKFIWTLRKRKPLHPDKPNNIDTERFASWLSLKDRRGLHITYSVKDRLSGHSFPSPPPNSSDMSIVEHSSRHSSRANAIRIALPAWLHIRRPA